MTLVTSFVADVFAGEKKEGNKCRFLFTVLIISSNIMHVAYVPNIHKHRLSSTTEFVWRRVGADELD